MNKKSLYLGIALLGMIGIVIYYLPNIYNYFQNLHNDEFDIPKEEIKQEQTEEKEVITKDSEIISTLTYPIMRNDIYLSDSYYQLDSVTMDTFSNNDILYNAFIDLYDGYIIDHTPVGCTNSSKEVEASYLSSRIKNVIGRNVNYTNSTFNIPNYKIDAEYVGEWRYDINSDSYIYYGDCNYTNKNIIYYDLTNLSNVESENNSLYLYYDIAFSKIIKNGNVYSYTIYSDADMKNEITSGTINAIEQINEEFNKYIGSDKITSYRYTFKKGLCTYENYCFFKGEWVK